MKIIDRAMMRACLSALLTICAFVIATSCEPETILAVNQTSLSVNDTGGSANLSFVANKPWTATPDQSWCKVSPAGGDASADPNVSVSIVCEANTTYDPRSCKITIQCAELTATVIVEQTQNDGLFISPSEYELSNEAHRLNVEVKANIDFEVISNVEWIRHIETKALKTNQIVLDVAANETYDDREGKVIVRQKNGELSGTITVKQDEKPGLFAAPEEIVVSSQASVVDIEVKQNVAYDLVIPDDAKSWISVVGTKSLQSGTISLSIAGNPAWSGREASVIMQQRDGALRATVKIIQSQTDYWSMESVRDSVGCGGGEVSFSVVTNMDYQLSVPDFATWMTLGETREEAFEDGRTKYLHSLTIAPNESLYSRSVALSFVAGSQVVSQFVVYQEADAIIEFEDKEVKRICVANWDLNKDGELSRAEAAAVTDYTSFMNAFSAKSYKSFDEFRFFTGFEYIASHMFEDWFRLESIRLPETITGIWGYAFFECTRLKSIDIPSSVRDISWGAFSGCQFETLYIPKSVAVPIGGFLPSSLGCNVKRLEIDDLEQLLDCGVLVFYDELFISGKRATSVEIPQGYSTIRAGTFRGCSSIKTVTFHEGVAEIETSAFSSCKNLTSIVLPKSLTRIRDEAFAGCEQLRQVTFHEGLFRIDEYAFYNCSSLERVILPESVEVIGTHAFSGCTSLASVVLPEGLEEIPDYLFSECRNLSAIRIPEAVTRIGANAFVRCTSLASVVLPEGLEEIPDGLFSECRNLSAIRIPEAVTRIGAGAFWGCRSLASIELPRSIEKIGARAFENCTGLKKIIINASVPPEVENYLFHGTNDCPIFVPAGSVNAYKTARLWSYYADRIRAIE